MDSSNVIKVEIKLIKNKIILLMLGILLTALIICGCGKDYTEKFGGDKFEGYWLSDTLTINQEDYAPYDSLGDNLFGDIRWGVIFVEKDKTNNTYKASIMTYYSMILGKDYFGRSDYIDMITKDVAKNKEIGYSYRDFMSGPAKLEGNKLLITASDYASNPSKKTTTTIVLEYNPSDGTANIIDKGVFGGTQNGRLGYQYSYEFSESKTYRRFTKDELKQFISEYEDRRVEALKNLKEGKQR